MVEDAETLTTREEDEFVAKLLFLRDHLRDLLDSAQFAEIETDQATTLDILKTIERYIKQNWVQKIVTEKLRPPRELTHLSNYASRAKWQYYKSRSSVQQFEQLIHFAQHDRH